MASIISLSAQVYDLLVQHARSAHQTPEALAEDLLRRSLTGDSSQWQQEFESLLTRVQSRTARFSSAEIEADITAAAEEAKELRRARRRAS